jgi:hypothetical protein
MLGFAAYAIINHMDRLSAILRRVDLNLKDIAPLFFNDKKFTRLVISAVVTFGFFILFSVSLIINIVRAMRVSVKLF